MSRFTVQLLDNQFGRVLLSEVDSTSQSAAATLAEAAPPVSGPNASAFSNAGQVVDQSQVLKVTGTDPNGNPVASPTQLPVVQSGVVSSHL